MAERPQKRMKTANAQGQQNQHVTQYKYIAGNVFARLPEEGSTELLFNRPHTFAFLDNRPVSRGHAILVVKQAVATILEGVSDAAACDIFPDLQALAKAVQEATQCAGIQVLQSSGPAAGQSVPQLHFHVIPAYAQQEQQQQAASSQAMVADSNTATSPAAAPPVAPAAPATGAAAAPLLSLPPSSQRLPLAEVDAGPLIAAIRNALPPTFNPGYHHWAATSDDMEALGHALQAQLRDAGTVVLLNGNLGAGKSTIARGFVRAFCRDASLDVPSPTFLLCLSYAEDCAHDKPQPEHTAADAVEVQIGTPVRASSVHHMDPYRLGLKADKMSGLINFEDAFARDVCLIEWPDRMPKAVLELPKRGVSITVSGTGIQSVGRHITVLPLSPEDPSAAKVAAWRAARTLPPAHVPWRSSAQAAGGGVLMPGRAGAVQQLLSTPPESWVVLGIESSCDDTAAAVVTGDGRVLAHEIASQAGLHEQYGGVKPDVARDAHAAAIGDTVARCLASAGISPDRLTAVACTVGPGLSLCLQVGLRHALSIAAKHQVPLVPVHHMEAHALVVRLPSLYASFVPALPATGGLPASNQPGPLLSGTPPEFPALLLLVSGGHNMLVLCQGVGRHRIIGTTLDDSAGECFDKVARLLGIGAIPGGPQLEKLAAVGNPNRFKITLPMQNGMHKGSCNFSFSGLKTSVAKLVETERARLLAEAGVRAATPSPVPTAPATAMDQDGEAGTGTSAVGAGTPKVVIAPGGKAPGTMLDEGEEMRTLAADIAASFQKTTVTFLQQRTRRALSWLKDDCAQHGGEMPTSLVVAGGVAANTAVREGLTAVASEFGIPCIYPPIKYCTDNGLMVAWAGVERLRMGLFSAPPADTAAVERHVDVLPRWPLGPTDPRSVVSPTCNKHRTT